MFVVSIKRYEKKRRLPLSPCAFIVGYWRSLTPLRPLCILCALHPNSLRSRYLIHVYSLVFFKFHTSNHAPSKASSAAPACISSFPPTSPRSYLPVGSFAIPACPLLPQVFLVHEGTEIPAVPRNPSNSLSFLSGSLHNCSRLPPVYSPPPPPWTSFGL